MRFIKRYKIHFGLGMVIMGLFVYIHHTNTRGVCVYINNDSNALLHDIKLIYTGGIKKTEIIKTGAKYKTYINPKSESDLRLRWKDNSGKQHSRQIDVYIEHNYRGQIKIKIDLEHRVSWTDNIKTPSFL